MIERLQKHSVEQLRAELRAGIIALTGGAPGPALSFVVAGTAGIDAGLR